MTSDHTLPSVDLWLREAKSSPAAPRIGIYLTHNGVVRATARAEVRAEDGDRRAVTGMDFSSDPELVRTAEERTRAMEGVFYVRTWLNEGHLSVGDDLMLVLIGADTRPHAADALSFLVGELKSRCVREHELHG